MARSGSAARFHNISTVDRPLGKPQTAGDSPTNPRTGGAVKRRRREFPPDYGGGNHQNDCWGAHAAAETAKNRSTSTTRGTASPPSIPHLAAGSPVAIGRISTPRSHRIDLEESYAVDFASSVVSTEPFCTVVRNAFEESTRRVCFERDRIERF